MIFTRDDWRYGLRCMDCGQSFHEGQAYSKRLIGFVGEYPCTEIVCALCGLGLSEEPQR